MKTYRMTEEEFRRLISERDPLAPEFGTDRMVKLATSNPRRRLDLGFCGVVYDAGGGFYWTRVTTPVAWM